jgi:hypothetical protein
VTRPEVTVHIHAWLEERELEGLEPAFRARLSVPSRDATMGAASRDELHRVLDDVLGDAGLLYQRTE